jgi:DNA-binding NtrC family response regulator
MGDKRTILIVEDDATVRSLLADMLSGLFTPVTAATGVDALRLIEADVIRFDLVLSDVMMPGEVSGLQLIDRMRVLDPQTPVLLISGDLDAASAQTISDRGIRLLRKPFRQQQLLDAIEEALKPGSEEAHDDNVVRLASERPRDRES